MRQLLTAFIIIVSVHGFSQSNWTPLTSSTTSVYHNQSSGEVILMKIDSTLSDSTSTRRFVFRKKISEMPFYNDSVWLFSDQTGTNNHYTSLLFYDFIIDSNITITYAPTENGKCTIDTKAPLGDTLNFNGEYVIVRDSVYQDSVLGMIDSIAHFSVYNASNTEMQLLLSKSHGLLEFPDLKRLHQSSTPMVKLIGTFNENTSEGIVPPSNSYFWSPALGDQFLYKYEYSGNWLTPPDHIKACTLYFEHIYNRVSEEDSTKVLAKTNYYTRSFVKTDQRDCGIDMHFWAITHLDTLLSSSGLVFPIQYDLFHPILYYHEGQFEFRFSYSQDIIHPIGHSAEVANYWGYTKREISGGYEVGNLVLTLFAAKTTNGDYGIWPHQLGIETHSGEPVSVFPNPGPDVFHIASKLEVSRITASDVHGRTLKESRNQSIDLRSFPNGMYFLTIETDNGLHQKRVILNK